MRITCMIMLHDTIGRRLFARVVFEKRNVIDIGWSRANPGTDNFRLPKPQLIKLVTLGIRD